MVFKSDGKKADSCGAVLYQGEGALDGVKPASGGRGCGRSAVHLDVRGVTLKPFRGRDLRRGREQCFVRRGELRVQGKAAAGHGPSDDADDEVPVRHEGDTRVGPSHRGSSGNQTCGVAAVNINKD